MIGEHRRGLPFWRTLPWRELFRETMREADEGPSFAALSREACTLLCRLERSRDER